MNFFMEETKIIDENDTMLNVIDYFNVDHELEWWVNVYEHSSLVFWGLIFLD
jgi:hypothetical protein